MIKRVPKYLQSPVLYSIVWTSKCPNNIRAALPVHIKEFILTKHCETCHMIIGHPNPHTSDSILKHVNIKKNRDYSSGRNIIWPRHVCTHSCDTMNLKLSYESSDDDTIAYPTTNGTLLGMSSPIWNPLYSQHAKQGNIKRDFDTTYQLLHNLYLGTNAIYGKEAFEQWF